MQYPIWTEDSGDKVSCVEKVKVMEQNLDELQQMAQDAFEDGILMGVSEQQLKNLMTKMMAELKNPYN